MSVYVLCMCLCDLQCSSAATATAADSKETSSSARQTSCSLYTAHCTPLIETIDANNRNFVRTSRRFTKACTEKYRNGSIARSAIPIAATISGCTLLANKQAILLLAARGQCQTRIRMALGLVLFPFNDAITAISLPCQCANRARNNCYL